MSSDPYKVLGLQRNASEEEIKKKYRALVKQYHPDLHPNDPVAAKKMSEINAAYEQIKSGAVYGMGSDDQDFDTESFTSTDRRRGAGNTSYNRTGGSDFGSFGRDGHYGSYYRTQSGFGTAASQMDEKDAYDKILNYITAGQLNEASSLLYRLVYRTGMWYYCAAQLSNAEGNYIDAVRYADTALVFDRNDPKFASLAAEYHRKYDALARRRHILPVVLSIITMGLVALYIMRFFLDLFDELTW